LFIIVVDIVVDVDVVFGVTNLLEEFETTLSIEAIILGFGSGLLLLLEILEVLFEVELLLIDVFVVLLLILLLFVSLLSLPEDKTTGCNARDGSGGLINSSR
jgi:hypothetical protein